MIFDLAIWYSFVKSPSVCHKRLLFCVMRTNILMIKVKYPFALVDINFTRVLTVAPCVLKFDIFLANSSPRADGVLSIPFFVSLSYKFVPYFTFPAVNTLALLEKYILNWFQEEDPYITVEFKPKCQRQPPPVQSESSRPEGLYMTITDLKPLPASS